MTTSLEPHILLVGDNRGADARAIERSGLSADTARNCLEAIVKLSRDEGGPSVVVLSAREIEGREAEAMHALKEARRTTQVLLTLPPGRDTSPQDLAILGVDDSIAEPYLPDDLLSRIRLLMRRGRDRAAGLSSTLVSPQLGSQALADLVADLTDLGRSAGSLDQVVDRVIEIFELRTGARRISLLLLDRKKGELVLRKGKGLPTDVTVETRIPLGWGVAGRCAQTREPILVRGFENEEHRRLANRGSYETSSCLVLPLTVANHLLGVLNLADKDDGRSFEESDLYLLQPLAAQAAQAIDTALRVRRLRALTIIDDLTGLFNRRHFRRTLDREFRRAVRYRRPLSLAILDVDHFKIYNDRNGHEAGNRALQQLSAILKDSFRDTDTVARYGGEEFAVILPELTKGGDGAARVLSRLQARVQDTPFEGEAPLPGGRVTISGGVAAYPDDAQTVKELVEAADQALYRAKDRGRNRIEVAG